MGQSNTITKTGLSSSEVNDLQQKYGLNQLPQGNKLSGLRLLWEQFQSPLAYILFIAGIVTLLMKQWDDAVVIFLAVGINVILGFFQEYKAEKSLEALNQIIVPKTRVIRDGQEQVVEATLLVPGDLVILSTGNKVPADGKLVEQIDLEVNEAILTGESMPVLKKSAEGIYLGTEVVGGRGQMLVTAIGSQTKVGQIAHQLLQTEADKTPLKQQLSRLSRFLVIILSGLCLLVFTIGMAQQRGFLEIFTLSVALAVASIPEGLMISLTVILTLGMQRVLKRGGLVRKLMVAETLASVDVICADKTGTLTEGKMKVVDYVLKKERDGLEKLVEAAVLGNNMTTPVELAMMEWGKTVLRNKKLVISNAEELIKNNPRLDEMPFSSKTKFIAILTKENLFVSGAPEKILSFCQFSAKEKQYWLDSLKKYAQRGLRIVSFAWRERKPTERKLIVEKIGNNLINFGLLIFEDPPRLEVKESLAKAEAAGIHVKVITGDYYETAKAVIEKLGIESNHLQSATAVSGEELDKMSEKELIDRVDKATLFYRTTPEHKIKLVHALQKAGHVVAMMGDGVNDALALKKADIGIVMGEAAQVAKETADMVLLDSNFKTIVAAIEEGRGMFINIRKLMLYLLSHSFTEIILIGGSFLMGLATPLLSVQILWINLVEHGMSGMAMAFEPKEKGLMKRLPFAKNEPILSREMKLVILLTGIITDILFFAGFYLLLKLNLPLVQIRTVIFVSVVLNALVRAFSCKSLTKNLWQINLWSNKYLAVSSILGIAVLLLSLYLPVLSTLLETVRLNSSLWLLSLGLALIGIVGVEAAKSFLADRSKKL
jgi:Ca2+-transporting ATPase